MIRIELSYAQPKLYPCQECGGDGRHIEVVLQETGQGPWEDCGWCNGTGKVDGPTKARWLNYKKNYYKRSQIIKRRESKSLNGLRYDWVWFE
jgi:DnaJ-class molecular chaperone